MNIRKAKKQLKKQIATTKAKMLAIGNRPANWSNLLLFQAEAHNMSYLRRELQQLKQNQQ